MIDLRSSLRAFVAEHSPEMLELFRRARRAARNYLGSPSRPFERIYLQNLWGNSESRSGVGSTTEATAILCRSLPGLLQELGVRTVVDAPCGDYWLRRAKLELERYRGLDSVPALIAANTARYASPSATFQVLDLTEAAPPRADLILCRDLLIHLSFRHARRVLANFKRSGSTYLLCSTNPDHPANVDIVTGSFRPLNLRRAPFDLPAPMRELDDGPDEAGPGTVRRTMALWRLADLPIA